MTFRVYADLSTPEEHIVVDVNGARLGRVFQYSVNDCPAEPSVAVLLVSAVNWNYAVGGGDAVISMVASEEVDPYACDQSWIQVSVLYRAVGPGDCQRNGVPDECDIASGTSQDVNGNGVPDECECVGDVDGDGDTDQADIGSLLADWGCTGGSCQGDLDGSGETDFADIVALLAKLGCGVWCGPGFWIQ